MPRCCSCTLDGFLSPIAVWERPDRAPAEWTVPREEVDATIAHAMERFEVAELACDPPGWAAEIDAWTQSYGDVVVQFPTNVRSRMIPACDRFRAGVLEGDISHDGSEVVARHLGHVAARETPAGTLIGKDAADSPRKIDAAVAAVVAYERAAWHASNPLAWVAVW